jgi:hypothetical protein
MRSGAVSPSDGPAKPQIEMTQSEFMPARSKEERIPTQKREPTMFDTP